MKPIRKNPKLLDAPMAITSSGEVMVNVTHLLDRTADPVTTVRQLQAEGHEIFVGVAVPAGLQRELLREVDDGLADVVGRLGPSIRRRGRP